MRAPSVHVVFLCVERLIKIMSKAKFPEMGEERVAGIMNPALVCSASFLVYGKCVAIRCGCHGRFKILREINRELYYFVVIDELFPTVSRGFLFRGKCN